MKSGVASHVMAVEFLKAAGVLRDPVPDADARLLEQAMPLVAERINKLTETVEMLDFLFVEEAAFFQILQQRRDLPFEVDVPGECQGDGGRTRRRAGLPTAGGRGRRGGSG